ncbi:MAG: metal-dependent phosphohydrolase [Pseudomonadota bacterium]
MAACADATPAEVRLLRSLVAWALGRIAQSDAPYHDIDHSIAVCDVARLLLLGRKTAGAAVSAGDWLHLIAAAALHDIGYLHGIVSGDRPGRAITTGDGKTRRLSANATDAALAAWHVDRAVIVIRQRLAGVPYLDGERLIAAVEATRFPPPARDEAGPEGRMLRAADLIGQFADPAYPRKIPGLFVEFRETGEAARQGYAVPSDIWSGFPAFYDSIVSPQVEQFLPLLALTAEGRGCAAALALNRRRAALMQDRPRGG